MDAVQKSWELCRTFFVSMVKIFPVILTLWMLSVSYYVYVLYIYCHAVASLEARAMYLTVFHILFFLLVWSYFKAVFTRPISPPNKFRLPEKDLALLDGENSSYLKEEILRNFAKKLHIMTFKIGELNDLEIRYCSTCRIIKPDRAHHCKVCRKCVLKMDHHCPLINNCVTYSNYKFYVLCLAYSAMISLYVVSTTVRYVIKCWSVDPKNSKEVHAMQIIMLFFVATTFSIISLSLFALHFFLIFKNRTSKEIFRAPLFQYGYDQNGFDLGYYKNIQQVFGNHIILWPFPVHTSLGKGVSFLINESESQSLQRSMSSE